MKMYRICTFSIFIFIVSCSTSNKKLDQSYKISIDLDDQKDIEFSDLFEELDYVFLKTEGEVLGTILKLDIVDEKIFVSDQQNNSLYVFDLNGNLINTLFRYGKGRGEYLKISDFYYDPLGKIIYVMDRNQGKVISYLLNGEIVNEFKLPKGFYSKLFMVNPNRLAIYASNERMSEYNYKIIDNHSGDVHSEMMRIDLNKSRFLNFLAFSNFYRYGANVFTYQIADEGMIYRINQDTIVPHYQINFGEKSIPPSVLNEEFKDVGEFVDFIKDKYVYRISNIFETENYLLFGFHYLDQYLQCIYDKKQNKYVLLPKLLNDISTDISITEKWAFSNNSFKGNYNNKVYGFFWSDAMLFNSDSRMIDGQQITEETNPVVYIGKLKNDIVSNHSKD